MLDYVIRLSVKVPITPYASAAEEASGLIVFSRNEFKLYLAVWKLNWLLFFKSSESVCISVYDVTYLSKHCDTDTLRSLTLVDKLSMAYVAPVLPSG